jgi:hypothetical protein
VASFTDDFNRADSSALGAGWVEVSGDWSIVSSRLSAGAAGGTIILRAAGAMASNDHYAQVTIATTAAVSHGVWCRGNTNISQGYLWRNDGSSWNLFSVVGGSFTSIGSFAGAAVNGDVAKVQAVGSLIKGYVNGIERVSVTNTAVTTGTSVGLRSESAGALRFDDFAAADIVAGSTGDAALSGTGTLTSAGTRGAIGASALAATATLTTTGLRATTGSAERQTTATLAAGGVRGAASAAGLAPSATLTATGSVGTAGQAALTATAALATDGTRGAQTGAALGATADLTAQGQTAHSGSATLAATATLTAEGATGAPPVLADAALTATGTLTATGARATTAASTLEAAATLAAAGATAGTIAAALAATATLTASGTTGISGDDVDITVGAPYSPWAAGQPYASAWTVQAPQASDWEVGSPC